MGSFKEGEMSMTTIFKKINNIQMELSKKEFKKSGFNKFGGFSYFEIEDILPTIQEIAYKYDILIQFVFEDDYAKIFLIDTTNGEKFVNKVPLPEVKALNSKMNVVQSLGAYITYTKRYLLLNTFGIVEKSVIDSSELDSQNNNVKPRKTIKKTGGERTNGKTMLKQRYKK